MLQKTYNWGIIGLGKIAHKFAEDLILAKDANIYGVASRNIDKALEFSKQYNSVKYYGSYEDLVNDINIDIVYIATPHSYHCENTLMALEAGKAVICEKAFAMNRFEVEKMINKAKEKNVFLMEALWTRFIPSTEKIINLIKKGVIGELKSIRADFGFTAKNVPSERLFDKSLGGGSLLDTGIYPVFLSLLTLGFPEDIKAFAFKTLEGIDNSCAMLLKYKNGQLAILDCSIASFTPIEACLHGSLGYLKMHNSFQHTKKISHFEGHDLKESYDIDYMGNGYYHEIIEVMRCLNDGKIESEKMPLSFSLEMITILDRIREEIALTYE